MAAVASPTRERKERRPSNNIRHPTAPSVMSVNGHFANMGENPTKEQYEHGIQVINENQEFKYAITRLRRNCQPLIDSSPTLPKYLSLEKISPAGFNYHLISVFGSQSTGKSTLLNYLFGTQFGVMSEDDRRQTTKGIWMSKNKKDHGTTDAKDMAENILVMDVEGTDGRERGEDQDFERKSALFALATSEVLLVNIWEHQVGLYQGANMGLLKVVFEVNLELFLKDKKYVHRYFGRPRADLQQIKPSVVTLLCYPRPSWHNTPRKPPEYSCARPDTYMVWFEQTAWTGKVKD